MVQIVGAGMAGLLAANMLRHRQPLIYEAQPSLPNNHSAVLRFRTDRVARAVGGIKFRKVTVVKSVLPWRNPIADALAYSKKNLGLLRTSRSVVLPSEKEVVERYIAPPDFVAQMAEGLDIRYGEAFDFEAAEEKPISTIPLPNLLDALGHRGPRPNFEYVHGLNVRCRVDACDAYATLYVPHPEVPFSRVSITGDEMIVELPGAVYDGLRIRTRGGATGLAGVSVRDVAATAAGMLGMSMAQLNDPQVFEQRYAKIAEIDDAVRRDLIFWHSSVMGKAYALGRFATWRPGLLLDDVVDDVEKIDAWIGSRNPGYDMDLHHAR